MSTEGFEWVWQNTIRSISEGGSTPQPSPGLQSHLQQLYSETCRRPAREEELEAAIVGVLRFLASDSGQTGDDCRVVSNFIMPGDDHWEEDWDELPERFVEILGIMGHELWQAAEDPEWAESYGGTPKQILDQLVRGGTDAG